MSRSIDADKLIEYLEKQIFSAELYGEDWDGQTVSNLLCLGDVVDAIYSQQTVGEWIPADRPPETDETWLSDYILLSFENFPVPTVGRYELDEEGNGAYYAGDSEKSCVSEGLFVNAWMPLPEPYKGGAE